MMVDQTQCRLAWKQSRSRTFILGNSGVDSSSNRDLIFFNQVNLPGRRTTRRFDISRTNVGWDRKTSGDSILLFRARDADYHSSAGISAG